jgi:hypothetical protein
MAQVVEYISNKFETLNSNHSTAKKIKQNKRELQGIMKKMVNPGGK